MSAQYWKKTLAVVAASALMAGLFTACGGADKQSAGTPKQSSDTNSQQPVKIDWLAYNSYGQLSDPDNNDIVKLVQNKFNAKFNVWYLDAQKWDEALNIKLSAGELPDVLKINNLTSLRKLIQQNVAAPVDEETVRKLAPSYAKVIDEYSKQAWDFGKVDGKLYALPSINLNSNYPTVVIWREDWLKKVGIAKTPETIQEVEDALTKFRNDDPDGNGKKDTYGLSDFAIPAIFGAFGHPAFVDFKAASKDPVQSLHRFLKDGKIAIAATQPEMKDALALLQKWYKAGLIDPEFLTSENTTGYWGDSQAFYNGKIGLTGKGMFYHWRNENDPAAPDDQGGGQYSNFKKSQPNGSIAFGKAPVGPQGKSGTPQWQLFSNSLVFTSKAVKNPRVVETVLKMIEAVYSDEEFYRTTVYGIKGKDWNFSNGKVVSLDPDKKTPSEVKGRLIFNALQAPPAYVKSSDPFTFQFADKAAKISGYQPLQLASANGFPAFEKNSGALGKLVIESYFKIITGEWPVSKFDDFVKQFYSSGGTEIEKESTDAYNQMIGKK